jgi:Glycogen debranching enzyme
VTRLQSTILRDAAAAVLRRNDRGRIIAAVPDPSRNYRWHRASILVVAGLARTDLRRAMAELDGLLAAQWRTGMLPLCVFDDPGIGWGFDPRRWSTTAYAKHPDPAPTSGLAALPGQPIAARMILERGRDNGGAEMDLAEEYVANVFDVLLAAHRWTVTHRDPDGVGLVEIHHPWESMFAACPRWDAPLSRTGPHPGASRAEREWYLLDRMHAVGWDETAVREVAEFRVRDVLASALLAGSAEVLAELADEVGRTEVAEELEQDAARFRAGIAATIDPRTGLARDYDVRAGVWLDQVTIAGFAPLIAGGDVDVLAAQRAILLGDDWMGHPVLRHPLPPTVSPSHPEFRRRERWRGPVSPWMVLALVWAATRDGAWDLRAVLRDAALEMLGDHSFAEFYEPITGEPIGPRDHSWTASVTLDLLG